MARRNEIHCEWLDLTEDLLVTSYLPNSHLWTHLH